MENPEITLILIKQFKRYKTNSFGFISATTHSNSKSKNLVKNINAKYNNLLNMLNLYEILYRRALRIRNQITNKMVELLLGT